MELLEKLKVRCNCLKDIQEEEFEPLWNSFIRFLSNITCWDIQGGTILEEERTHAIQLNRPLCEYTCIDIQPYWKNINLATVSVEIRQYTSSGVTVIPIDEKFYNYDDFSDRFYVNIAGQLGCECPCEPACNKNILVFRYKAGYDLDTPEWLDLICHYMTGYVALANQCININDCCAVNAIGIGARLVRKTVDTINYEWETDEDTKEVFFNRLMQNFYINMLGKYALCGRDIDIKGNIIVGKDTFNYESKIQRGTRPI